MERMSTDIYALKKQYTRIKKRQQQQSMQLCIRTERVPDLATSPGILRDHREKESGDIDDKCPATRVTTSQLNSSTVINHLLLGQKPKPPRLSFTTPGQRAGPSHPQRSPSRQRCTSSSSTASSRSSPWRDHVRMHRRNIARARAQLGFEDSEEKEDEEDEDETNGNNTRKRSESKERVVVVDEAESDSSVCVSPNPSTTGSARDDENVVKATEVGDVVVQLHALDLKDDKDESGSVNKNDSQSHALTAASQEETSHQETNIDFERTFPSSSSTSPPQSPPSPPSTPIDQPSCSSPLPLTESVKAASSSIKSSSSVNGLSSSALTTIPTNFYRTPCPSTPASLSEASSSNCNLSSSPSTPAFATFPTPKQPVFSPFPCVKQPRKSAAARNLGLYGPTSKTPTVHFPQMSRNLSRCGNAAATGRR